MARTISFRIYTHNIRYDNRSPTDGEELWETRKYLVVSSIRFHARANSFVCLQEALHHQLLDILEGLGSNWAYVGVGRDDGETSGEFAPILYRKDEWNVVNCCTTWLSPTPDVPSRGWDAALPRILTWASFENISTGGKANIFNTHLDHQGVVAREESAKLILDRVKTLGEGSPAVLVGDFNSTDKDNAYRTVASELVDASKDVAKHDIYGHTLTYTGFNDRECPSRIDYVWVTRGVIPHSYGVLHSRFNNITFSDHRPVVADIEQRAS
jgi:endonuclease/exonuclease/phosphatase family metal-dependent hydrolase